MKCPRCGSENQPGANLRNLELPMLLPRIRINTSPSDYFPIKQAQMVRFDGKEWVRFGEVIQN